MTQTSPRRTSPFRPMFFHPYILPFLLGLLLMAFLAITAPSAQAANIVVEASGDVSLTDGLCTLREALINANSNIALFPDCAGGTGTDTITFTAAVSGVPILPLSALPPITGNLTVDGSGKNITIFGNNGRPFTINSGTVELKNLKITGGTWPEGGGIYNQATLTLTDCTVAGNAADSGGGIFNKGTLILNNSNVSANDADNGGGIFNLSGQVTITGSIIDGNTASEDGGGIWSDTTGGELTRVIDSTISNNVADNRGGGIAHGLGGQAATLLVSNSTIRNNKADYGGGLYGDHGTMTVNGGSVIRNNEAFVSGGGINNGAYLWINDVTISSNKSALGGGISNALNAGLESVTITDNFADSGGGIYSSHWLDYGNASCLFYQFVGVGQLTIKTSIIGNNTASDEGGGLYTEGTEVHLESTTVKDNTAGSSGGGIWNSDTGSYWNVCGDVKVYYSTISGNRAVTGDGGGVWNDESAYLYLHSSTLSGNTSGGDGGGIWNDSFYVAEIINATISENIASDEGGGIYSTGLKVESTNSIIAKNIAGTGSDCRAAITGLSVNLFGDPSGCNFLGIPPIISDPKLGPLTDNTGLTKTHALLNGSPAIDSGHYANQEQCLFKPYWMPNPDDIVDQRGVRRPQGSHCDLGAYESEAHSVTPSVGRGQGIISPSTVTKVPHGHSTQFMFTPVPYSVAGTCGGSLQGNIYTTNPINAACSVVAHFVAPILTVTPSASAGGSISPSAPQQIAYGNNAQFSLSPDPGFHINRVAGTCGGVLTGTSYRSYTTIADCSVEAIFAQTSDVLLSNGFEGDVPTYQVGDTGPAGGIVFHVFNGGARGLEAAPADLDDGTGVPWGCPGTDISTGNGATGTAIGTGDENTDDILLECAGVNVAARLADDFLLNGYDDWYLPSQDELNAMYVNLHSNGLGNFNTGDGLADYWSSTEYDKDHARHQYFYFGTESWFNKNQKMRVRAVRSF